MLETFMSDKKVALLSSGLGHVKRGIESWTEDMGRALAERGVPVTVFKGGGVPVFNYEEVVPCLQRASKLSQWIIQHRPQRFMWRLGLNSGYSLEQMTFCWSLLLKLVYRQFDIIHTQDPGVAMFCHKLNRMRLIRSKVILAHGTEESFTFLNKLDYIQHLAPFHLEEAEFNGVINKKSFAIGNFVDIGVFNSEKSLLLREELNIPSHAFVVLSVAAIKKHHKRIDHLIREVAAVRDQNVYLVVAGAREMESDGVISEGREALGERVVFLVNFPRERINALLAMADIFALCSLKEMMPIALLEALSSGLPCLVHHYPVEEWMIGEGGESLDMARAGELARVIQKYMNVEYRLIKGLKAREQAVTNFSKDVIINQVLKMYMDIL